MRLLCHGLFDFGNCFGWVESLWASLGTVKNSMASINRERILHPSPPLRSHLISTISHPSVRLQQHRRSQVLIRIPPVRRAACRAARTKDTFVETVKFFTVLDRLQVFPVSWRKGLLLKIRLDALVLFPEPRQVLDRCENWT